MASQIFVNLPVKDLARSVEFFSKLGYSFDPRFTDEHATSMIVGENIYVMLLVESFFANFTKKPVADAKQSTEAIFALALASQDEAEPTPPQSVPIEAKRRRRACRRAAAAKDERAGHAIALEALRDASR